MNNKNIKVAILGYGLEGRDAEKYFKTKKANVTILDQKFDNNYLKNLDKYDLVVRSAGVYPYKPEFKNINITSPTQLFFENCKGKIIGVTGTKGKGTTSTLIYEIIKKSAKKVFLAGNIGKPYLELLPIIDPETYVVLEMSSFQLIDMDVSPHISVVLNITSDHMDWHKNQDEYISAKRNIVLHQSKSDFAVINKEYVSSKNFGNLTKGKVIYFSKTSLNKKYKKGLLLRGQHNLENIAAAVRVAEILKITDNTILDTVLNFKGLEHRLELVKTINGVTFYNDSFATGPQPTIAAIKSFTVPETLILGGSDKGLDYEELRREIEKRENVKNLILIGEIGQKIAGNIKNKNIINLGKTDMNKIVKKAYEITPKGGVVIFSPAAASFDMFENYKDRGNQFKKAVEKLKS
ncbi:MAG: UDP-N-acetylmuramoyl-L-alanine--D-glutamate ligase [Patescibacteria group bacterium]